MTPSGFTFHWCDGESEFLTGETPEAAFSAAGYEPAQIFAVEYFVEGSDASDEFAIDQQGALAPQAL